MLTAHKNYNLKMWTREATSMLIEEYQANECMWMTTSPFYRNKQKRTGKFQGSQKHNTMLPRIINTNINIYNYTYFYLFKFEY